MITNYLMSLNQNQLFIAILLIASGLLIGSMLCIPLGFKLIESEKSSLNIAGISAFFLSGALSIFCFGWNPANILQRYTSGNSDKYYMQFHGFDYQLYKKPKADQKLNSQVKIVNQKSDELVGIVKCGEISVKECFDQINASSVSSNTEVDHNTVVVSK